MVVQGSFVLLTAVTFLAALAQGAVGIGFALIMAPIMGVFYPSLMPATLLLLMLPLNALVAAREFRAIDWHGCWWVSIGRLPGTLLGMMVLWLLSRHALSLFIGISTIIAVLVAWWSPAYSPGKKSALGVGIITGITETSTGVGGPPLALLYQHRSGPELRSSIAMCFLIGEILSLLMLGMTGKVTQDQLLWVLRLLPPLLLGTFISRLLHGHLNVRRLRHYVLLIALISGIIVLF